MASDREVAFPTLSAHDIDALKSRGHTRNAVAGTTLFAEGDRDFCFFVVVDGAVEIVEHSTGVEKVVTVHGNGEFTGDVDMLSGRVALIAARTAADTSLIELSTAELRRAVDELPELGETILKAFLMRRTLLVGQGFGGVRIIGSRFSPEAHRLRDFATRNAVPFTWLDLETDEQAEALLREFGVAASDTPIVISREGDLKIKPTIEQFAKCAGLTVTPEPDHTYDLIVVGAGPAGLAASVYGASEGLSVLTVDSVAAGGQAGTSSRIENYLGFPTGISGADLTRNALLQAQKFGAQITVPCTVKALSLNGGERIVRLEDGTALHTRCVIVATGVQYRRLSVSNLSDFEGAGIYYAATDMEARLCRGEEVVVVGAGNSAGQAIVYLAKYARKVHVVLRRNDLGETMSRYLVDRVENIDNVTIHRETVVSAVQGNGHLGGVTLTCNGETTTISTNSLFLFIGADPNTAWLRNCVELDKNGFVVTGTSLAQGSTESDVWKRTARSPFLLETSLPGIFAVGDVRSGSVKRVASAVGEGSMAVSFVHAHIARPA